MYPDDKTAIFAKDSADCPVSPPQPDTLGSHAISPRPQGRILDSIVDAVGHTPLVRLSRIAKSFDPSAEILLKLEHLNPLGSIKDRIGIAMIADAEARGLITPTRTLIVEPTSGNTGIALAFAAAAKGYRLLVIMPKSVSSERIKLRHLLGVQVELTDAELGMAHAIRRVEEIVQQIPGAWSPRQFDNPANPAVHEKTPAEEIWLDCDGRVDIVIAGVSSGGTISGIGAALKPRNPALQVVAVEPAESAVLSGDEPASHDIQGIGAGLIPATLNMAIIDRVMRVTTAEAGAAVQRPARREGIACGLSTGAVLSAAIILARSGQSGQAHRRDCGLLRRALSVDAHLQQDCRGPG
jgi:cysteine synthase A